MMELWMETFHDSPEYVNMLFNAYFSEEHIEYEISDGKLVAAMLAIPYHFEYKPGAPEDDQLKTIGFNALYLCGLATRPEFRNKGIMGRLIDQISSKAELSNKYDFLFLIPADKHLAEYYMRKKFMPFCWRKERRFITNSISQNHSLILENSKIKGDNCVYENAPKLVENIPNCLHDNNTYKCEVLDYEDANVVERLIQFLQKNQFNHDTNILKLIHSEKDFAIAIEECKIAGGRIYFCEMDGNVKGVAFTYDSDEEIRIYALQCDLDEPEYYHEMKNANCYIKEVLLEWISENNAGKKIFINNYSSSSRDGEIYGMLRNLHKYENSIFLNNDKEDLKYSILTKEDLRGEIGLMLD